MERVLVTGSTGFVGRALVKKLEANGYNVVTLDSSDGDISEASTFQKISETDLVHVFHLAAKTFVPESWEFPDLYYKTNVMGTLNALELSRKKSLSVTYISSYVYGEPEYLPIDEKHRVQAINPYAHSKVTAEQLCEFYAKQYGLDICVIRPFNIYGVGQKNHFLIPEIIMQASQNEEIKVKDLTPKRDYVFLEDFIDALLLTVKKKGFSIYNIGSGKSHSVSDVIASVQSALNVNKPVVCENRTRKNEVLDVIADISKAQSELNWAPSYDLDQGIQKIISEITGQLYSFKE